MVDVRRGIRVWICTYDGQWGGYWSRVHVYVNSEDFKELSARVKGLLKPGVELSDRQKHILATVRAYKAEYRREVLRRNSVTVEEMEELNRMGLLDARGTLTSRGRLVAEDLEAWY